jgi:hypothetical protein
MSFLKVISSNIVFILLIVHFDQELNREMNARSNHVKKETSKVCRNSNIIYRCISISQHFVLIYMLSNEYLFFLRSFRHNDRDEEIITIHVGHDHL